MENRVPFWTWKLHKKHFSALVFKCGVFAFEHNGTKYVYVKDVQGNIVALLDTNGTPVVKYVYDAWGKNEVLNPDANGGTLAADHIGKLNPFRYRGYYYDTETGLYYLKTRYYDPEVGRFLNADDVSFLDPDTVNGLNLYAYCGNDPVNAIDPSGCAWEWFKDKWNRAKNWINENKDVIIGTLSTVGAVVLAIGAVGASIATFGAAAVFTGVIASAALGGIFGGLNAKRTGGSVLQGVLTGAFVGALGSLSAPAAALGAFGASLINNNINGGKADSSAFLNATITGITAGLFSKASSSFARQMISTPKDALINSTAVGISSFTFSVHNFVTDVIINAIS